MARSIKGVAIWAVVLLIAVVPVVLAASSPLLDGRSAAYIWGGMAGVLCLPILLFQPLMAANLLPGLRLPAARRIHHLLGVGLVLAVALHVGGLYLASPMDALDALLLVSPTPFSIYGVLAMWTVALTAILAALRLRLGLRYRNWRILHNTLAAVIAVATVIHAVQIDGAMDPMSKWVICLCLLAVVAWVVVYQRLLRPLAAKP